MGKQVFIGLTTEGTTDIRFLESIVLRTFHDIAFNECTQDVDILLHVVKVDKVGCNFAEYVLRAAREGLLNYGIHTLVVHTDSDRDTYEERIGNKITPALQIIRLQSDDECCKLLTPIIPVKMMEAWMLADRQLLKEEIGTSKSDEDLGLCRDPESIANPKALIEEAIRIATEDLPKRRQRLSISDLYGIIGTKIDLEKLSTLPSYIQFKERVRETYRELKYLY